ncbi:MAG: Fic family protein [Anaerolineaceae bacterium]|nr:Fic family protein [Anaerolineaceae bacterium]
MAPVHYHQGTFPPDEHLDWRFLAPMIEQASQALGRYSGALDAIPNSDVLLSPLTEQEAVLSSRIEGTQATMKEVLLFEAGREPDSSHRRDDYHEVINYRVAMQQAKIMLFVQPISQSVIQKVHQILLSGVRGKRMTPGQYRTGQNWIGPSGSTMKNAAYVPASANHLCQTMNRWETYASSDQPGNPIINIAILHAEFEAIHPFWDGNGRLGRILIPLLMWKYGLIQAPVFYISDYLEAHRSEYYDGLLAVSKENDWTGWCRFFLGAVARQAEDNLTKVREIMLLYAEMKHRITEIGRSKYGVHILDGIFNRPVFTTSTLVRETEVPARAARRILERLTSHGILTEVRPGRGSYPAIYLFGDLMRIAEGRATQE